MLVIREEQIQHFIAEDEPALIRLIRQIIREVSPERVAGYSDRLLDTMVKTGVERAKSRGFTMAEDITAFVAVMFEIAPDFDKQKDIEKVLDDKTYPLSENFKYLWERVPDTAWKEAEENYDVKVWFPEK